MTTWNIHTLASFVSIGGLIFGLDTGAIGPVTVMPQFLETATSFGEFRNHLVQGVLVASILMGAATASLFAGSISDKISRKRTIALGACITSIGSALEAGSIHMVMLLVARLIAGAGEGLFLSTIGVYLIEISPPRVRGRISCVVQLFITIGIASGYFICYGSVRIQSSLSWRLPFIIQSVLAAILAVGMEPLPYSPRWLIKVGRTEEAFQVLESFDRAGVEREKAEILARNDDSVVQTTVMEAFSDEKSRWRMILAIFLMGMQQLSGIDAVLYFAPLIFTQAGLSSQTASFLASGISGVLLVVSTIPSQFYLIDRWGRRSCIIWGGVAMAVCMLIIGSVYASGTGGHKASRWTVISMIYLFVIAFSVTWAVALRTFVVEVQPNHTRAMATSLAFSANWVVNLTVALTTPYFLSKSPSGPYFMFAACLLITTVVCILCVPETLGKNLSDIDAVWDARTLKTRNMFTSYHRQWRDSTDESGLVLQGTAV